MTVRVGYACISLRMREQGVYCSRGLTLKSLREHGVEKAQALALENIADMRKIILYNESIGIRFWRITSNLFPHMENPRAQQYDMTFARDALAEVGKLARSLGHRLTMHPGQFAQLGSPRPEVVEQTARDLRVHADIFRAMGLTPEMGSVMIIHGGGTYGDKAATLERFAQAFLRLPEDTRKYIALENDEFGYSVLDLLPLCERLSIPPCIDFFHHRVGHEDILDVFSPEILRRCMSTWKLRGIKPKCHWSNQDPDKRKGSHSACVKNIPRKILEFARDNSADIMLEVKDKDLCALKMLRKHFRREVNSGRVEWYI